MITVEKRRRKERLVVILSVIGALLAGSALGIKTVVEELGKEGMYPVCHYRDGVPICGQSPGPSLLEALREGATDAVPIVAFGLILLLVVVAVASTQALDRPSR